MKCRRVASSSIGGGHVSGTRASSAAASAPRSTRSRRKRSGVPRTSSSRAVGMRRKSMPQRSASRAKKGPAPPPGPFCRATVGHTGPREVVFRAKHLTQGRGVSRSARCPAPETRMTDRDDDNTSNRGFASMGTGGRGEQNSRRPGAARTVPRQNGRPGAPRGRRGPVAALAGSRAGRTAATTAHLSSRTVSAERADRPQLFSVPLAQRRTTPPWTSTSTPPAATMMSTGARPRRSGPRS